MGAIRIAVVLAFLFLSEWLGAQNLVAPVQSVPEPVVTRNGTSPSGGLKTTITVHVKGLSAYLAARSISNPEYVLYLQGTPLPNLAASVPTNGHDDVRFYLDRIDENRGQWAILLRNPVSIRTVPLTVGLSGEPTFRSEVEKFQLKIYDPAVFWFGVLLFLALIGAFIWIAIKSDVLREAGPPPPATSRVPQPRRAYSLARVQMTVWFFVVLVSFSLIWLITYGVDTISPTVLTLIGISTGTGLAASIIDGGKIASLRAQKDQLLAENSGLDAKLTALDSKPAPLAPVDVEAQTAAHARQNDIAIQLAEINKQIDTPTHVSFLVDILSDANGISFHRFQMASWTLVLVVVFLVSVSNDLTMPDFNATLLGLMGISSGTYLGFKFPETKN